MPYFHDNQRRQLAIHLSNVHYPVSLLVWPHDSCIEALVIRGAVLMSKFLQGEHVDQHDIAWVKPAEVDAQSEPQRRYVHMIVAPLMLLSAFYLAK